VGVCFVAGESRADGLDGRTGEDGDTVVGLLSDGDAFVAEGAEDVGREFGSFEFLEEQDVRGAGLDPGCDVIEAGFDGVDVPTSDDDGGFLSLPCGR
jgi:hypothetical protein